MSAGRLEPVYNLTVADAPEFFANGVLVHNCDASSYAAVLSQHDTILRAYMGGQFAYQSEESKEEMGYDVGEPNRTVKSASGGVISFLDEPD
mgnify:CR=1 FL=1